MFYEIARKDDSWLVLATFPSGPPSYTIDETGHLIGWSRDSGDVISPPILKKLANSRKPIPLETFFAKYPQTRPAGGF